MADKSERSKGTGNELTLDEVKTLLKTKAKQDGEISMKEISDKLAAFDLDSEEIFNFADEIEKNDVQVEGKEEFEEEALSKQEASEETFDLNDLSVPPGVKINDPVRMYLKEIVVLIYFQVKKKLPLQNVLNKAMTKHVNV